MLGAMQPGSAVGLLLPVPHMERRWVRRFEVARLIGAALLDSRSGGVLGRASSHWTAAWPRRRSGAFAAQLLLPESGVAARCGTALDAAARPEAFSTLLSEFGVGASAAAWHLWNRRLLSSPELRDELIAEFSAQG